MTCSNAIHRQNCVIKTIVLIVFVVMGLSNELSAQSGANQPPTWQWRCDHGDAFLNYNPAVTVNSSHGLVFDSIPYARNYTIVVVYKPIADTESTVWRLDYDEESNRGLTTEHILAGSTAIRYTDTTTGIPVINTLRQTAPDSVAPYVRLTLGGDTLGGSVKVAELLYFNRRLNNSMLRRVQSVLAVRYGITLGPVDYVDGEGNRIWDYADSGMYHHRVTGVGKDSTYNIRQLRSLSEMPGAVLTIKADSLSKGEFFLCGDNDAPLVFEPAGDIELLSRQWKINSTDIENNYFHLTFDTRTFAGAHDSLVLLADGFSFLPDSISSDEVTYRYVTFQTDTSTFTLARGAGLWLRAASANNGYYDGDGVEKSAESYIYPNPSTGNYTLEVTGASWVKVNIYNAQGMLMESFSDSDQWQYTFSGNLPGGNSYYATVTTESGTQILKLIVK